MFRTVYLQKFGVVLTAVVAVLALANQSAEAQVKPFKITGEGIAPFGVPLPGQDPRPHSIVGNATHLGRYKGAGFVQTNTADFHPDGSITGEFESGAPFVFEGANGDILSCDYGKDDGSDSEGSPGTFLLVPDDQPGYFVAFWTARFVPVADECTGKFAGVSSSWVMYAESEPFLLGSEEILYYSWSGKGSLEFAKKAEK